LTNGILHLKNGSDKRQQKWTDIKKLGIGKFNTTRCDANPDEPNEKCLD